MSNFTLKFLQQRHLWRKTEKNLELYDINSIAWSKTKLDKSLYVTGHIMNSSAVEIGWNKTNNWSASSWFKYWLKGPNQPQNTFDMFYSIFSRFQNGTSIFPIPPETPLKLTPKLNSEDSAGTQKVSTFLVDTFLVPMLTF